MRYVALHCVVSCCQAELDQFIKGPELHGVLNLLCAHPNQEKRVLQGNLKLLNAELIDEIFNLSFLLSETSKEIMKKQSW